MPHTLTVPALSLLATRPTARLVSRMTYEMGKEASQKFPLRISRARAHTFGEFDNFRDSHSINSIRIWLGRGWISVYRGATNRNDKNKTNCGGTNCTKKQYLQLYTKKTWLWHSNFHTTLKSFEVRKTTHYTVDTVNSLKSKVKIKIEKIVQLNENAPVPVLHRMSTILIKITCWAAAVHFVGFFFFAQFYVFCIEIAMQSSSK